MSLILAIDDDRNMLKILDQQLQTMGYRMISASSGNEGLELAQSGNPDLILLDIMMPGMDGFEVIKRLHMDEMTKKTPILMVTSKTGKEDVIRAMKLGVADYIVKPYLFENLHKKIDSALRTGPIVKDEDEDSNHSISVHRISGIAGIALKARPSSRAFLEDARQLFNPSFLTMTKKDTIVIDLRGLPEFGEADVKPFEAILKIFAPMCLNIVAGKHFGEIVALTDLESSHNLFISYGDFEVSLGKK